MKYLKLVAMAMLGLAGCQSNKAVKIEGSVPGLQAGEIITLTRIESPSDSVTAETVSAPVDEKGNFSMEVSVGKGRGDLYKLWAGTSPGPSQVTFIYLDEGQLRVDAKSGKLAEAIFSGTQNLSELNEFNKGYKTAQKTAEENYRKGLAYESPAAFVSRFIATHPSSPVATSLLDYYGRAQMAFHPDTVVALFGKRDAAALSNLAAGRLKAWETETADIMPGKPAPTFSMPDTSGNNVSLADFKGKYVLLDFWASWCVPCRAENPNLVKAFNQYKDKGFTVLGVSLDQAGAKKSWLEAIHHDELTWTQLSELNYFDNTAAKMYHLRSIPSNFLIDPKGVIIARNLRGKELQTKLVALLMK